MSTLPCLPRRSGCLVLMAVVGLAACSDPSAPPPNVQLIKFAGDATACPVNSSDCRFTVRLLSLEGQPLAGKTIVWSVGAAATLTTTTDARGFASAPNLVAGAGAGAASQHATAAETNTTVVFSYSLVQPSQYQITLRFLTGTTPAQQAAFTLAKQRWEQVITGNLPAVTITGQDAPANECGIPHPPINETVDDLLVLIRVDSIDGPGKILGSAGPCFVRSNTRLPIVGVLQLDSADLAIMEQGNYMQAVILHELGHVIGLPYLWCGERSDGSCLNNFLQGKGGDDPFYTGPRGGSAFMLAGGAVLNRVPVENTGEATTRDGHWRESVLGTELMTGYINAGNSPNPLSAITIGAMMDAGYQVNFGAADAFLLPITAAFTERWGYAADRVELVERPMRPPRVLH